MKTSDCWRAIKFSNRPRLAFTRMELLACMVCVAILLALALPALAASQSRSHSAQCLNNLRQMGRAVQMWASDHTRQFPWRTTTSEGGEFIVMSGSVNGGPRVANAWVEYAFISNQLVTPHILACPADSGVKVASEFSNDGTRGYMSTALRANATSYFINVHTLSEVPSRALFGDRNLSFEDNTTSCSLGFQNVSHFFSMPSFGSGGRWTNAVHGLEGNLARVDGSVRTTTSEQVPSAFFVGDSNGSEHLLKAR